MTGQPQHRGEPPQGSSERRACGAGGCMDDRLDELFQQIGDIDDGHRVECWALVMSTVGHRPDGTEVRRTYRYAPAHATRGESEQLLSKGAAMVRAAQPHPGGFTSS